MGKKKKAEALGNKIQEAKYHPYTREQLEAMLPAVGTYLMRTPAALDDQYGRGVMPRRCVAVEVNTFALWYRVRFLGSGLHQCFKVPEI